MPDKTVARFLYPLFTSSHDEIGAAPASTLLDFGETPSALIMLVEGQATLFDAALSTFLTMKHFM